MVRAKRIGSDATMAGPQAAQCAAIAIANRLPQIGTKACATCQSLDRLHPANIGKLIGS
jgi:hypothetical protein